MMDCFIYGIFRKLYKIDFEILILGGYYGILGGFVNWILDLKCLCDKY